MKNVVLHNCRILAGKKLLDPGWIEIELGKIAEFGEGDVKGDIDGRRAFLFPGLIDFHCGTFQLCLCPHPGTSIPTRTAKISHETLCLKGGITTVLNTLCLSDIAIWSEANATITTECHAVCQELPESNDGPNHLVHLRCDLAWSQVVPKTISFLSEQHPRVISFIRCCPGAGRFRDLEAFQSYLRQRWRGNILDVSRPLLSSRNPGDDEMWKRAKNIISSLGNLEVVLSIHDPSGVSDILRATGYKIQVAEFPVDYASVDEAKNQHMAVCMSAPNVLRGGSQYGNLSTREVWDRGKVDLLTSDYCPTSLLEATFNLTRDENGILSVPELANAIHSVTQIPAQILGLKTKGSIKEGNDADLVLVRPNRQGQPEVEMTLVGGVVKYCSNPGNPICAR